MDFIGTKIGNLTVVGWDGERQGANKVYQCHCSECAKDPELFGSAIYNSTKYNLVNGRIPCGCGRSPRWTVQQYRVLIERKSNGKYSAVIPDNVKSHDTASCSCSANGCGHEWEATVTSLLHKGSGCKKCAGLLPIAKDIAVEKITKIANEKGWIFHGFEDGWQNCYSKLRLECHCGRKWSPTYNSAVNDGTGCPKCGDKAKGKAHAMSENTATANILKICSEKGWLFHGFKNGWNGIRSKLLLECSQGHTWDPMFYNVINGIGCRKCSKYGYNPGLPGTLYCHLWTNPEGHSFLKYGITNKPKQRLTQQKRNTEYIPKQLFSLSFEDGTIPKRLEDAISEFKKVNGILDQVSREDFPDGHTETLPLSCWDFIRDLIQKETGCRLQPLPIQ